MVTQGNFASEAERIAYETVILPVIKEDARQLVQINYKVDFSKGGSRFIDFAIITPKSKIAMEIDGFSYHAEGQISQEQFADQLKRQNELILEGWLVIRYSYKQITERPTYCQDVLRRSIIHDENLHRNYITGTLEPTQIQKDALKALEDARSNGTKKGVIAIPTGTGKTILSAMDAKRVGGRVLFIVHNNEILRQAKSAYQRLFVNESFGLMSSIDYSNDHTADLVFANIATLRSYYQLKFKPEDFSYIIVDEVHHGAAESYLGVLRYFTPKFLLGITATPERADKKDILSLFDNNLLYALSTSEAIEKGLLAPFTYYALHDNVNYSDIHHNGFKYDINDLEKHLLIPRRDEAVYKKYMEISSGAKAIGFCVSIKHAERMADVFCNQGISSIAIHSELSNSERKRRMEMFSTGQVQLVFVRDIFNEGVDFPEVECLLFLRPTESRIVFIQQLGRGLRLSPNKNNVNVLDFIGNYHGIENIPSWISSVVGDGNISLDPRVKPTYVFENNCKVIFSEKVVENLILGTRSEFDRYQAIDKIISLYEREGRALLPIDLFSLLKKDFPKLITSFETYKNLCERMNTLVDNDEVLDLKFENFKFNIDQNLELSEDTLYDCLSIFEERTLSLFDSIDKTSTLRTLETNHSTVKAEVFSLLSTLNQFIPLVAFDYTAKGKVIKRYDRYVTKASDGFFNSLKKLSASRNAYASTNFIVSNLGFFRFVATGEYRLLSLEEKKSIFLEFYSTNAIRLICDLYYLLGNRSLRSIY